MEILRGGSYECEGDCAGGIKKRQEREGSVWWDDRDDDEKDT